MAVLLIPGNFSFGAIRHFDTDTDGLDRSDSTEARMASETRMARRRDGWLFDERIWVRPG